MTTAETVTTCIAENMGIAADTITPETTLADLGIDSLDQIEIAMDIETALGCHGHHRLNETVRAALTSKGDEG